MRSPYAEGSPHKKQYWNIPPYNQRQQPTEHLLLCWWLWKIPQYPNQILPKEHMWNLLKLATLSNTKPETQKKVLNYLKGIKRLFLKTTGQINRIDATSDCQSMIQRTVPCLSPKTKNLSYPVSRNAFRWKGSPWAEIRKNFLNPCNFHQLINDEIVFFRSSYWMLDEPG